MLQSVRFIRPTLSIYVTDSVDKIPGQCLLHRDLEFLLLKMKTYNTKLTDVYGKIVAILARLNAVTETLGLYFKVK
jgi:hypothetical protein